MKNNEVVITAGDNKGILAAANAFAAMLAEPASNYDLDGYTSGVQKYAWPVTVLGSYPVQDYNIVISAQADQAVQDAAADLQDAIKANHSEIGWLLDGEDPKPAKKEVVKRDHDDRKRGDGGTEGNAGSFSYGS